MANNLDRTPSKVTTNRQLNYNVNNTFNDEGTGYDGNHNRYNNIDVNHNNNLGNTGNVYDNVYDPRNNNNRIIHNNNNNNNRIIHDNNGNVYDNVYDPRSNNHNNNLGNTGNVYDNVYDPRNNNNRIIHNNNNNNYNQCVTSVNHFNHDALAYMHDAGASINEGRRLLRRLSVLMDNPMSFGLLRERNLHRFFGNVIRAIVSRNNGDDMADANENTNPNTKKVLKEQREIVNEVFNVATKWMENAPAGASLLDYFYEADNVQWIFNEDAGGYVNIENKNMVGSGIFWLIDHYLLSHQKDITDENENKAIVSLGRVSRMIDDKSFGKEGGLSIVIRLLQPTNNPEHQTILEGIITHITVTIGWR